MGSTEVRSVTPPWLSELAGRSEMGAMVAAYDWNDTSLGPVATWPSELRVAVRMCLSTRFPVLVTWGPDLIKIYNDGYRAILGPEKHPMALGTPVRDVWPEIWDTIGPMFEAVMVTGQPTFSEDEPLLIERNGSLEQCFFTFSYSPLTDDDGDVAGVVDIVTETTLSVRAQRRLGCLASLSTSLSAGADVPDLSVRAVTALAQWPECFEAVDLYLRLNGTAALVASNRRTARRIDPLADLGPGDVDGLVVLEVDPDDGSPVEVAIAAGQHDGAEVAVMVARLNGHRPFDDGYRNFVGLVAQSVGASLERAVRHANELDEYRHIGDVLQEAMLKPASDFPTVAARYLPATGNLAVGGDWYDVIELDDQRRALVVGDCVGHGLRAAAAMSQLRAASRSLLLQGLGPAAVLDGLDRYALSVDDAYCTTAVCIVVDRSNATLTYSRAGHLPPLVVHNDTAAWLDEAGGPPLGVLGERHHTEAIHSLLGDELVVMYSDGLVERRGEVIDVGLERLAEAVSAHRGDSVHAIADAVVRDVLPDDVADDVVLVVKRMPPSDAPEGNR